MSHAEVANVNGSITPLESAVVPVSDHGFLYGDSVYETIRTYDRRAFLLEAHLDRLRRSADGIRLILPWSNQHLAGEVRRTVAAVSGDAEIALRLVATRGRGPLGYAPGLCGDPNLVILARMLSAGPEILVTGVTAAVVSVRRNPIESLDPRIKSSNLLNNIMAAHEAHDAGAQEAILFNTAGELSESSMANIFLVSSGVVRTPAVECGLLAGVTRDLLLDLARQDGLPVEEGRYGREVLEAAEEIFLTSTTREVFPVTRLDGRPVGDGGRGPVTRRLQELYRGRVEAFLAS